MEEGKTNKSKMCHPFSYTFLRKETNCCILELFYYVFLSEYPDICTTNKSNASREAYISI